jgi:L-fuculose-phosphate aldolase
VRVQDGVLITPSATPYAVLTPDHIVKIPLDGTPDATANPSNEWPFHTAVLRARPDVHAVVHAHPAHATAVATQRRAIPAVHYMVAAFGGSDVPCTDYATYGARALSDLVVAALADRDGCPMANHCALTLRASLDKALWRMQEL